MTKERKIELLLNELKLKIIENLIEYTDIENIDLIQLTELHDDFFEELIDLIKG